MYVKVSNQQVEIYPYSIGQLRKDNPQTSFPKEPSEELLEEWGLFPVVPTPRPPFDHTKKVTDGTPVFQDGAWVQVWDIVDASPEEIQERTQAKSDAVREERNQRLAECDWTQLADAPVDSQAWATYRQALRDITAQSGFPLEVTWPTAPQ